MSEDSEWLRKIAIDRACNGENHYAIWTSLGRSRSWFYNWLKRFKEGADDWFKEQPSGSLFPVNRTKGEIEEIVVLIRNSLYNQEVF